MDNKRSFLLGLFLILLLSGFSTAETYSQTEDGYLIIGVYESEDPGYAKIVVTEGDEVLEEADLPKFYYKKLGEMQAVINRLMNKYQRFGYVLVHSSSSNIEAQANVRVTHYIFEKK